MMRTGYLAVDLLANQRCVPEKALIGGQGDDGGIESKLQSSFQAEIGSIQLQR